MPGRNPHKFHIEHLARDTGLKPQGVYGRLRSLGLKPNKSGYFGADNQDDYRKLLAKVRDMPGGYGPRDGSRKESRTTERAKATIKGKKAAPPKNTKAAAAKAKPQASTKKSAPTKARPKASTRPKATIKGRVENE